MERDTANRARGGASSATEHRSIMAQALYVVTASHENRNCRIGEVSLRSSLHHAIDTMHIITLMRGARVSTSFDSRPPLCSFQRAGLRLREPPVFSTHVDPFDWSTGKLST